MKNNNDQNSIIEGYQILEAPNQPLINYRGFKFSTKTDLIIYKNQHYVNYYLKWINIQSFKLYYNKQYYVQCLYIKNINAVNKREVLLFSQCFLTNFATVIPFLVDLSNHLRINIITYQYNNKDKEAMNYLDVNLVFNYLNKLDFVKNIILVGLSVGNKINMNIVLSKINLYPKTKLKAIILISPTWVYNLSDLKHLKNSNKIKADVDKFLKNVNLYNIPVFIIHGKKDAKVKYFLSLSFSQQIKKKFEWFPKNGNHLDIINSCRTKLLIKIKQFLNDNDVLKPIVNDPYLLSRKNIKEFNDNEAHNDQMDSAYLDNTQIPQFGTGNKKDNKDDDYYGYYNDNDILGKSQNKNKEKNTNLINNDNDNENDNDIYTVCKPKIKNENDQTFQNTNSNDISLNNQTIKNNNNDITLNQGENPDDVSLCGNNANDITINDNAIDYDNENINKLDMSFLPGDVIPSFNHRENKKLLEDVSFM